MAAAQQMMISPEDLQQLLLQGSAAAQQPSVDWNPNAEILHQLQQMQQVLTSSSVIPVEAPAGAAQAGSNMHCRVASRHH